MKLTSWLLAAVLAVPFLAQNNADRKDWIQLFNGKNLDGWVPKIAGYPLGENFGNTFRVEDGILKVRYDQYTAFDNKFGHLFYKQKFSYYLLAAEYRSEHIKHMVEAKTVIEYDLPQTAATAFRISIRRSRRTECCSARATLRSRA